MVAVISNGTAILGLGNLGALASKPVMEGKAVLFKRFADVDAFDLEVDTEDADAFINCVRYLGADLRRHQPRGHQGAGVLHHRGAPARADGHPGLPRRPARHGDHRRGGPDQRAAPHRARHRDDASSSSTAPAPPASPASSSLKAHGLRAEQRHPLRHQGRRLPGPQRGHEPVEVGACGETTAAHPRRGARRRRRGLRPLGQGRLHARHDPLDGARTRSSSRWPIPIPRSRVEEVRGDPRRRHHGDRPLRLSEPGQQRARLPLHLPRRPRRARHDRSTWR